MNNKELTGVMFPNNKTNERQPDLRGTATIGGVVYEVAGWKRKGKESGIPYLSLAFQKKEDKPKAKAPAHTPKETVDQVSKAVGGRENFEETIIDDEPLPF